MTMTTTKMRSTITTMTIVAGLFSLVTSAGASMTRAPGRSRYEQDDEENRQWPRICG